MNNEVSGALFVFVIAVGMAVSSCSGDPIDNVTSRYDSYEMALQDNAIDRGWLPKDLPHTAHSIIETHDVDTNEIWIRFEGEYVDVAKFVSKCNLLNSVNVPDDRAKRRVPWWSVDFPELQGGEASGDVSFYYCDRVGHAHINVSANAVVDRDSSTVWYWTE